MALHFDWKRFWCPREGSILLTDDQYLADPDSDAWKFHPTDAQPYSKISATPCLILLGEPGIGKSTALRTIEQEENHTKKPVFIQLNEYASEDRLLNYLKDALESGSEEPDSPTTALIMDSLDECSLSHHVVSSVLKAALAKINIERLHIRIVCRTAVWPSTFEDTLGEIWGIEHLRAYELAPLRKVDVAEAATHSGLDTSAFLQEIARLRAQPLASKPISLLLLLTQFRNRNRLPETEAELYRLGCAELCKESREKTVVHLESIIDEERKLVVAQRISFLLIFSGLSTIWTGSRTTDIQNSDLLIQQITGEELHARSSFRADEALIRSALNSGLFTSRGPNRMGLAHHTFGEFMAAEYACERLNREQIEPLLMQGEATKKAVVPQLSEVASRLASIDSRYFDLLLNSSPTVLLMSDVAIADDHMRRRLIQTLLEKCDAGTLSYHDVNHRDRLKHLDHPDLDGQLAPYIINSARNLHARFLAVRIVQVVGKTMLEDELIAVASNLNENVHLRSDAIDALTEIPNEEIVSRLLSIANDSTNDPDYYVRSSVIMRLWPKHMTAANLFQLLQPKSQSNSLNQYDTLVYTLGENLEPRHIPEALAWAASQDSRHSLGFGFEKLLDDVIRSAFKYLDEDGVLQILVETMLARMHNDHGEAFHWLTEKERPIEGEINKLRTLLEAIVRRLCTEDTGEMLLHNLFYLVLRHGEFPWFIEMVLHAPNRCESEAWIQCALWSYRAENTSHTDLLLQACQASSALQKSFNTLIAPVELSSEAALMEKAKHYEQMERTKALSARGSLIPPASVRLEQVLEACESGQPCRWWEVVHYLMYAPGGRPPNQSLLEPDITTFPGWPTQDPAFGYRILEAAKKYILECDDKCGEWLESPGLIKAPSTAGYRALRLIHSSDPDFINRLSAEIWRSWAATLLTYQTETTDEGVEAYQKLFVSAMFHIIPDDAAFLLERLIRSWGDWPGLRTVLNRVEHIHLKQLNSMLWRLLDEKCLGDEPASQLLRWLAKNAPGDFSMRMNTYLPDPLPKDSPEREYCLAAAFALYEVLTPNEWPLIWNGISNDVEFGRRFVGHVASNRNNKNNAIESLTDEQIADLFIWILRELPNFRQPETDLNGNPFPSLSEREEVEQWSHQSILSVLVQRGTRSSLVAIERIKDELPELTWLSLTLQRAQTSWRSQNWHPLSPVELLTLAADSSTRSISTGDDLLEVIIESLDRLQSQLHGEIPLIRCLWDYQKKSKSWIPIGENDLSDFIANHLKRDLQDRGIVVNREVQIRPLEKTDILVDAVARNKGLRAHDSIQCIIETKGCWHKELNDAMRTQLVDRYLKDNSCQHGIYLIGYFCCELWDADDYRKQRSPEAALDELKSRFSAMAATLSVGGLSVRAYFLETHLSSQILKSDEET